MINHFINMKTLFFKKYHLTQGGVIYPYKPLSFLKDRWRYYRKRPKTYCIQLKKFDYKKQQVLMQYFLPDEKAQEAIKIGEQLVKPIAAKYCKDIRWRAYSLIERYLWLAIPNTNNKLSITINGRLRPIRLGFFRWHKKLSCKTILKYFQSLQKKTFTPSRYNNCWLFMDRAEQADDNAEHLYRYIQKHYPSDKIYFLLNQNSHDWPRLKKEGFKLINYRSKACNSAIKSCDKFISSHTSTHQKIYCFNKLKITTPSSAKFVFLQHGIIKDNLSKWLNSSDIDLFITSTKEEFNSIISDKTGYRYTKNEVALTGLPRHDCLLETNIATEKLILVMPTWRQKINGKKLTQLKSIDNKLKQLFFNSDYFRLWSSFLNSPLLKQLVEKNNYKVIFFPHFACQALKSNFNIPNYIQIYHHQIQPLFKQSAILITDYSSVAFEMAMLNKPVIYYQFDYEQALQQQSIHPKGYFNYEKQGFGPVATNEDSLIDHLSILLNNRNRDNIYKERGDKTLLFKDKKCCQRVYDLLKEN